MNNEKKVDNKHHDLRSLSDSKVWEICIVDESFFLILESVFSFEKSVLFLVDWELIRFTVCNSA